MSYLSSPILDCNLFFLNIGLGRNEKINEFCQKIIQEINYPNQLYSVGHFEHFNSLNNFLTDDLANKYYDFNLKNINTWKKVILPDFLILNYSDYKISIESEIKKIIALNIPFIYGDDNTWYIDSLFLKIYKIL